MAGSTPPHPPELPLPVPVVDETLPPVDPDPPYPVAQTVISQYQNSPILMQLVDNLIPYFDPTVRFNEWYNLVWNIDSAQGYGLDLWGRILGVGRVLHIPIPGDYFGFDEATDAFPFDEGIYYGGTTLTENYYLSDDVYRRLLLAKALSNITDGSIPSINRILMALFPDYGNCYVIDNLDMTMVYRFDQDLSAPDNAIAQQSGVLPKPCGVSATYSQG